MSDGVRMQKNMAMGGGMPEGDFGVEKMCDVQGGHEHPDAKMSHRPMGDGERGAAPPIRHSKSKHHAQANPDHGPHHFK